MRRLVIISILLLLAGSAPLFAQEQDSGERDLIYTFVGPVAGFGYNMITYSDWFDTRQETKEINGICFSGGAILTIFAKYFIGDFSLQFMYNTGGGLTLYHLYYTCSARYHFKLNEYFSIAPGGGIFLETPPSNEDYGGSAGLIVPVAVYFNTSFDTKIFCDLSFRYGIFGLGDEGTRMNIGITIGFLLKVGRI